ncbi:MAG: PIN domain-containing protein [bacterium]|nr:PIN domain-containing protein [bacterium]
MRLLIDTNVYIRALAGGTPDTAFLKRAVLNKTVVFSPIVIAEFLTRALKEEQEIFEEIIQSFPILSIDEETARIAAAYRKASLQTSRTKLLDCFLAAQAKIHNATLVTNNRSDFPMRDIRVVTP